MSSKESSSIADKALTICKLLDTNHCKVTEEIQLNYRDRVVRFHLSNNSRDHANPVIAIVEGLNTQCLVMDYKVPNDTAKNLVPGSL